MPLHCYSFVLIAFIACVTFADSDTVNAFELPSLPYAYDALEPYFDELTMRLHHGKHFPSYITAMKAVLGELDMTDVTTDDDLIHILGNLSSVRNETLRVKLRNSAGGYLNHKQFFSSLQSPLLPTAPIGCLLTALQIEWGSFENFRNEFSATAKTIFGSGFCFLVVENGKLTIKAYRNQDHPAMDEGSVVPLLGVDVWEHAYYKKYENRRAEYIEAFWKVVNWTDVAHRYNS